MHDLPLVSIMIPTYRQEGLVCQAVRSALAQTYPVLEVIVADDDPDSRAADALLAFTSEAGFRYVKNESNRGRVGNYRRLLHDLARGEYALNLDGDDLLGDPGYIARAVSVLRHDAEIAVAFARRQSFSGEPPVLSYQHEPDVEILDGTTVFLNYWKRGIQLNHLTAVYRRADAVALDFYRMNIISADMESLLRLIPAKKLAYVDTVGGLWRSHAGNASRGLAVEAAFANLSMVDSVCRDLSARNVLAAADLRAWRRRFLRSRVYGMFCTQFWDKRRYADAIEFVGRVARAYPLAAWSLLADARFVARMAFPPAGRIATAIKRLIASRLLSRMPAVVNQKSCRSTLSQASRSAVDIMTDRAAPATCLGCDWHRGGTDRYAREETIQDRRRRLVRPSLRRGDPARRCRRRDRDRP